MPAELPPHEPAADAAPPPVPGADALDPAFRLLFSGYTHPMWVYDSETLAFLDVNDAAIRVYGYSRAQFLAMRVTDIRPPEDVPALIAYLEHGPHFLQWRTSRHRDARGAVFETMATSHSLTFAGRPARMVIACPLAEHDHTGLPAHPARVLESVEQAVIATDAGGLIRYWNAGAARLWRLPAELALGRPVTEVVVPPDAGGQAVTLFAQQLQGQRWSAELWLPVEDGNATPVLVSANPFTGADGAVEGAVIVAQDISELHRSRETLQFLADVNAVLAASLDEQSMLEQLTRLAVPFLADWAVVDVPRDGQIQRVAASSLPGGAELLQAQRIARNAAGLVPHSLYAEVLQQGHPLIVNGVDEDMLARFAVSPEHLLLLQAMEAHAVLIVPLRNGDTTLGALTLISSQPERRYTEEELALAEEVARRAALALAQVQTYSAEQQARRAAEQAEERISRLLRVTAALAEAPDTARAARIIAEEGAATLGATRALLWLLAGDGAALQVRHALGYPTDRYQTFQLPTTAAIPPVEALHTGRVVFAASAEERRQRYGDPHRLAVHLPGEARISVPLLLGERAIGVLGLVFAEARDFSIEEQDFLLALGRQAAQALDRARLYDAETAARRAAEQAAARVDLLQQLTAALAGALSEQEVTQLVVSAGITSLGAIRTALLLPDADGTVLRSSSATGYPDDLTGELVPLTWHLPITEAFRSGQPVFIATRAEGNERFPESAAHYAGLHGTSRWAVPLLLGERPVGVLVLSYADRRAFSVEEQDFLLALGRQAAQALDRARLSDAERAARERIALLSDISAELAESLDYEETLQRLARLVLPLAGDLCFIFLQESDGSRRRAAMVAAHPEDAPLIRGLQQGDGPALGGGFPPGRVIATGKTEFIPDVDDTHLTSGVRNARQLDALRALQIRSVICAPLQAHGPPFGAMLVARTRTGRYTDADVTLIEEVARRASQAVENARLYQDAQETARRERSHAARLRMLAAAALDISAARTREEIAGRVVDQARAIIGAGVGCAVFTDPADPGGAITACSLAEQYLGWECPDQRPATGMPAAALRAARPLRLSRAAALAPGVPGHHPPISGWLSVPITGHHREPLGLLYLSDPNGDAFTAEDEAVLSQLALIGGVAVENLRLARAAAEADAALEADALKTELLNTVSHELRTPLAAIKGYTSNLLHFGEGVPPAERQEFLEEINAASDRLAELVDNLLHVARQQTGTLDFLPEPVSLGGVLARAVTDTHARHPGRLVELWLPAHLPLVAADPRRLLQALANLLDNALKYSPAGGSVLLRAAAGRRQVRITVADTGIGIPAAYRERVFERFFRVPGPRAVEIGGTGLGLSITRHIIEQHGGGIRLRSREGQGTIVTVTLPLA